MKFGICRKKREKIILEIKYRLIKTNKILYQTEFHPNYEIKLKKSVKKKRKKEKAIRDERSFQRNYDSFNAITIIM